MTNFNALEGEIVAIYNFNGLDLSDGGPYNQTAVGTTRVTFCQYKKIVIVFYKAVSALIQRLNERKMRNFYNLGVFSEVMGAFSIHLFTNLRP